MSRFFIPPDAVKGNLINVTGKEAHHIIDVMRLNISDKVVTFDGTGREYAGVIVSVSGGSLSIEVSEMRSSAANPARKLALIQAITKKDKMDYIVEKATELGSTLIRPVTTRRTIPVWDDDKRLAQEERWRKIAREAAKQCGRADVPEVSAITGFSRAIENLDGYDIRLIAVLNDKTVSLKGALAGSPASGAVIAIGPEGDFTATESEEALKAGFTAVTLGPRVLKSDTAGLAALAILNHELSN